MLDYSTGFIGDLKHQCTLSLPEMDHLLPSWESYSIERAEINFKHF